MTTLPDPDSIQVKAVARYLADQSDEAADRYVFAYHITIRNTGDAPAQLLSGISLTSDYALHDIVELWITDTTASVAGLDPQQLDCGHHPESCVGSVLVDSIPSGPTETGRSLLHFDLRPPTAGGPSGSAVVEIRLDEDPQQF